MIFRGVFLLLIEAILLYDIRQCYNINQNDILYLKCIVGHPTSRTLIENNQMCPMYHEYHTNSIMTHLECIYGEGLGKCT